MTRQETPLSRRADGQYEIDYEAFEAAITAQTKLFLLCNPHNPVGRVYRQDELARLGEICLRHGVPICSDEIHCDLIYSGERHIPIAALDPEIARMSITLMAPSKTFNLAGLSFAFAVIPDAELRRRYLRARKGLVSWINIMGWTAALAAYCEGQEWLEQVLVYLEGSRDFLVETVHSELPGVSMAPPQGTYLAWLDCRRAGELIGIEFSASPQTFFLKHARVDLKAGETYGTGGEGFVRLNFGCPRSLLAQALERMRAALAGAL
jgi:cystathionine beta-lyase